MFCCGASNDALIGSAEFEAALNELDERRSKRNAFVLALASGLNGIGAVVLMTLGGIIGNVMTGREELATLPIAAYSLGSLAMMYPASTIMQHFGRRIGFLIGAQIGFMGGLLAVYAIVQQNFVLFCAASALTGFYQAFASFYRFAAADTGAPGFRAKAVSWVMLAGLASAFLGAPFVETTKDLLSPAFYAGAFLAAAVLAVVSMAVIYFVDVPFSPVRKYAGKPDEAARPWSELLKQTRLKTAILAGTVSHGVMMFGMSAAPVAMMACNHSVGDAAGVMQLHLVSMYAPSFFTGHLVNRFGVERVILAGLVMLAIAGSVALGGVSLERFTLAMVLLGVGWNLSFIGATTMLTQCHRVSERGKVQGMNEIVVYGFVAFATVMAGPILKWSGWEGINIILIPFVATCFALIVWLFIQDRNSIQNADKDGSDLIDEPSSSGSV